MICDKKEIFDELENLSKPLLDFLHEYFNPNCKIIISFENIKIISDELTIPVQQSEN